MTGLGQAIAQTCRISRCAKNMKSGLEIRLPVMEAKLLKRSPRNLEWLTTSAALAYCPSKEATWVVWVYAWNDNIMTVCDFIFFFISFSRLAGRCMLHHFHDIHCTSLVGLNCKRNYNYAPISFQIKKNKKWGMSATRKMGGTSSGGNDRRVRGPVKGEFPAPSSR